jgi:hypothetical protein
MLPYRGNKLSGISSLRHERGIHVVSAEPERGGDRLAWVRDWDGFRAKVSV